MFKFQAVTVAAGDIRQKNPGGERNPFYDELASAFAPLKVGQSFIIPMMAQPKEKEVKVFAAHTRTALKTRKVVDFTVKVHIDEKSIVVTKTGTVQPGDSEG